MFWSINKYRSRFMKIATCVFIFFLIPISSVQPSDMTQNTFAAINSQNAVFFVSSCQLESNIVFGEGVVKMLIQPPKLYLFHTSKDQMVSVIGEGEYSEEYKRGLLIEGYGRVAQEQVYLLAKGLFDLPFTYYSFEHDVTAQTFTSPRGKVTPCMNPE